MSAPEAAPPVNLTKPPPAGGVLHTLRPAPLAPVDVAEPVLPVALRNRGAFVAAATLFGKRAAYRAKRFAVRGPLVLALLLMWSPVGVGRVIAMAARWIYDSDTATLRHEHAGRGETPEAVKAQAMRRANLHARWYVAGFVLLPILVPVLAWTYPQVLAVVAGVAMFALVVKLIPGRGWEEVAAAVVAGGATWWFLPSLLARIPQPPTWAVVVVLVAAVFALGWVGKPRGKALMSAGEFRAPGALEKPSAEMVKDALVASVPGIIDKNRDAITVFSPGVARSRRGYHLSGELPPGITVSDVMDNREEFAAALRRELGTVWPSRGHRHPGHLELFIADQPMATAPQPRWALLDGQPLDIFAPMPLFTDQEGRWVDLTLAYNAVVIGGAPGYGKSFAVREVGAAVALDPRVRIVCLDGKGNGDLRPLRLVAHGFYEGDEPDEIAAQLGAVKAIREEMRRRARFLRELPRDENPLSKVTSELVDRYPDLAPIVLLCDEVQTYSEHDDKKVREAFIAVFTDLVKRGRSAGIIPVFCTQKPDASALPSAIADNCSVRLCFRVNGQRSNDQVLGTEMHRSGVKATQFSADDKGLAWLKGDGRDPLVVRTVHGLDAIAAEQLMVKARAIREGRGLLTGQAAGEEAEREDDQVRLLDDAREVMDEAGADRMHLGALLDSLALLRPGLYGPMDVDGLGSALRGAGVATGQVKVDGVNRQGVRRAVLDVAATSDEDPDGGLAGVVPIR